MQENRYYFNIIPVFSVYYLIFAAFQIYCSLIKFLGHDEMLY